MAEPVESGKQKSPRWANLAILLLFTALSLLLAEWAFRGYERARLLPELPEMGADGPVNLAALGYNDSLVTREKPLGEFRILSFGDSYTYSVMEPRWSYNGVLQQALEASVGELDFRVVNLGEPATGTRQFRKAHEFWSQIFEHDAVLFHIFLGNDVLDDAYLYAALTWEPNKAVFTSDNPILKAGNPRVPRKFTLRMMDYAYAWWMSVRTRSSEGLPAGYNWAGLTSFDEQTFEGINFKFLESFDPRRMHGLLAGYEQVYLLLRRAQEISDAGVRVAVVLGPAEPQVDDSLLMEVLAANGENALNYDLGLQQRVITRLRDHVAPDMPLIDLTAAFRAARAATGEKLYFRRNTHWNREGNRLAGEKIAERLLELWFGPPERAGWFPETVADMPLLSEAEIDAYLAPLTGQNGSAPPVVSGAVRAVQMFDGISDDPENWAIAPLHQPVLIELQAARALSGLRLQLFDAGSRKYRLTVDARQGGEWKRVADHSETAVAGMLEIPLEGPPVAAIRITGLYSSGQEQNPENTYLHIAEVEFQE